MIEDTIKHLNRPKANYLVNGGVLNKLTIKSWYLLLIAGGFQCFFFFTLENIFSIFVVISVWYLFTSLLFKEKVINDYPFSFFSIFGYVITQFYLPVLFTLIEGKPVVYNLKLPYLVFLHGFLSVIVLIISFNIYRSIYKPRGASFKSSIQNILIRINIFTPPTSSQIWIMGFIGFAAILVSILGKQKTFDSESTLVKFIEGFIPFAYVPYFLFLSIMFGKNELIRNSYSRNIKVGIYSFLILIVSLMSNSRSTFILGFAGLAYTYFLGLLLGIFSAKIFTAKKITIALFAIWLLTGPISDLGLAMVIVRSQRDNMKRTELLQKTIETYQNSEAINYYRYELLNRINFKDGRWDENYLDNIFMARFSNLKFVDNSLVLVERSNRERVLNYSIDRFWATLPSPLLNILGIEIDKKEINFSSFGDTLFSSSGGENALGGKRAGHFFGTGMAAFGWWYLLLFGIGVIPLFYLLDMFVLRIKAKNNQYTINVFSLCGLLSLTTIFHFLVCESVVSVFTFLIRGWFQIVFTYWLCFTLARFVNYPFKK